MISQKRLPRTAWPHLIPHVQHSLNHAPTRSLGMKALIEVFSSLPAQSPFPSLYLPPSSIVPAPTPASIASNVKAARTALHTIHQAVDDITTRRHASHLRHQRGAVSINFMIGDYVLLADVKRRITADKLLCEWVGPYHVTDCPRPYIYQVTALVGSPPSVKTAHASRLKLYSDRHLRLTETLRDHIASQGLKYEIESVIAHRTGTSGVELLIHWVGFCDLERTWEPIESIVEDAEATVRSFVASLPSAEASSLRQSVPRLQ